MFKIVGRKHTVTEVRSDHLIAMINYCYEQAKDSHIEVLDFGDNEEKLSYDEQLDYIATVHDAIVDLRANHNRDLLVVAPSDEDLETYREHK